MAYVRKTEDEYDVEGNYGYGHGWEAVTTETTWREARNRLREYRENEPGVPFRIRHHRVKITTGQSRIKTRTSSRAARRRGAR